MHVLIVPSEGFVPEHNKLEGIFQYHQAVILKGAGYNVGALSIRLSFSIPMIIKGLFLKCMRKKAGNATDDFRFGSLWKFGINKIARPQKFISKEVLNGIGVYRITALYRRRPANNKNHVSWIKAGLICADAYIRNEGQPTIIHAHDAIYAGMLAERIHAKYGIPYIITEHSSSFALGATDSSMLKRVRKAHAKATGLFAVSEAFAELLNKTFANNSFRYLPNVLDQYLETAPYRKPNNTHQTFRFLHIAVFKPVKDQQTLINAFKRVIEFNSNAELLIGGDGELDAELHQRVEKNNLQHCIRFLGLLNRDEVIEQLSNCDCFVLSSKYETFGVVVIEAMLFGKPVIVTRCGVGQDIVNEKIGYVVEPENEHQLAEAMLKMISTYQQYNPEYIREYTIKNFGKERFLQDINKIYKAVV